MAPYVALPTVDKPMLSTGNPEIDKKMGGGIPPGSLTLIEGQSDAGKSVLGQQLLWGALEENYQVVLYTSENTSKSLLRQMASLSLDVTDYFLLKRLRVYTIPASTKPGKETQTSLDILTTHMHEVAQCDLVIIDSLTGLIINLTDQDVFGFFARCKDICDRGTTVALIVHSYAFNEGLLTRLRSICDAHLSLKTSQVGDQMVKMLEVAKIRGADKSTGNIINFNVEPGLGMRIIPISKARA
jgi:archaeal flagellar protein FlaH